MSIFDPKINSSELHDKQNDSLRSFYYVENILWSLYRIAYSSFLIILLFLFGRRKNERKRKNY